jgi:purine catabolism regulator
MPDQAPFVSLGQLLALGLLPGSEVVGGADALDRPLRAVLPGTAARRIGDVRAGTVVVFERGQLDVTDVTADLALRLGHSAGIAGLVLERPAGTVPLATRRLADKFGIPLVLLDHVDPAAVVAALDPYVRGPEVVGATMVSQTALRLGTSAQTPDALVTVLCETLNSPVALVDSEGRLVAGAPAAQQAMTRSGLVGHLQLRQPAASTQSQDDCVIVLQPVLLARGGPANLWLVARLPQGGPSLVEPARQSLRIGAWAFTSYLATQSMVAEQQSRQRALLLTEILEHAENPPRRTVERATAAGWRLSGWHTAVHLTVNQPAGRSRPPDLKLRIEESLAREGLPTTLVDRPEGWVLWTTSDVEPEPPEGIHLTRKVRLALLREERDRLRMRLCAGVGRPYPGTAGLKQSMHEAKQASLLARTQERAGAVEHIDAMSLKRLLLGWYASGPLREVAAELLAPLRDADPGGELVRTLGTYLDHESSATTTALVLGVHRNTVLHRLDRIRGLLAVDLSRPDERLVAHLATRMTGAEQPAEFEGR